MIGPVRLCARRRQPVSVLSLSFHFFLIPTQHERRGIALSNLQSERLAKGNIIFNRCQGLMHDMCKYDTTILDWTFYKGLEIKRTDDAKNRVSLKSAKICLTSRKPQSPVNWTHMIGLLSLPEGKAGNLSFDRSIHKPPQTPPETETKGRNTHSHSVTSISLTKLSSPWLEQPQPRNSHTRQTRN